MARRADHTKAELAKLVVDTAEELIGEEGIDAFSARTLSRAIGYTAGTLYHHFKDLDDIVTQVNSRTLAGLAQAFDAAASPRPRRRRALPFSPLANAASWSAPLRRSFTASWTRAA